MARPKKDGLLYFSFDTDFFYSDRRIKILKAKYGSDGLMMYIYLLTEVYRNGYYLIWNDDSEDNALADLGISEGLMKQIMTFLVSRSLVTEITLANSDTIITSPGIQKRYQEAVKSLKREIVVEEDIWLLNKEETATFIKFTQNESKSEKNDSKSGINESKSEKNVLKEKKVNEKKVNKDIYASDDAHPPAQSRFKPPSIEEVKAYCDERHNNIDANRFIDFYSSKGWMVGSNKMKDWRAAIRGWERQEGNYSNNKTSSNNNKFHNFNQTNYDDELNELERLSLEYVNKYGEEKNE